MTDYKLRAIESADGDQVGWHLMKNHVATIGPLPTEDARDWAASWITSEDGLMTWRPDDGTVFAARWSASVADLMDDEEE